MGDGCGDVGVILGGVGVNLGDVGSPPVSLTKSLSSKKSGATDRTLGFGIGLNLNTLLLLLA